jgi:hypothetical protein
MTGSSTTGGGAGTGPGSGAGSGGGGGGGGADATGSGAGGGAEAHETVKAENDNIIKMLKKMKNFPIKTSQTKAK